jgi:hypothetical protein
MPLTCRYGKTIPANVLHGWAIDCDSRCRDNPVVFRVLRPGSPKTVLENKTMSEKLSHHGEPWTQAQVKQLEKLASQNTPTRVIGLELGRTEDSIYAKASEEGIPLKPTNQSPYNRRKSK